MAKCLVTGGAGFIGSHLVECLVSAGHRVRVLDNFSSGREENLQSVCGDIEILHGTITDADVAALATRGQELVFHLAALPSVQRSVEAPFPTHDACATGTLVMLEAARKSGVRRFVYAASSSAYGDHTGRVRSEGDSLRPVSPYAAAKLSGEHYCRCFTYAYGLETVRLRLFNVFGPRQDAISPYSAVISCFIAAMSAGRQPSVFGDGLQSRDFTYVENAVQAFARAADAAQVSGNVYNIGCGQGVRVLDVIDALNRLLGTSIDPQHAPSRPGEVRHSQADISRARSDLCYEPTVLFAEGLARTVNSHRSSLT